MNDGVRVDLLPLRDEQDVVAARQRARAIATLLGFERQDQARIATAVSEIARNAVRYARDARAEFALEGSDECRGLTVRIADGGPGIRDLAEILDGGYRSPTGMGLGIVGARRLMDRCDIASHAGGTTVTMTKFLDRRHAAPMGASVERIRAADVQPRLPTPVEELQQQQQELLVALAEARDRQEQLAELNRELEDTNRGVVALYAELDEKALRLRQADETKSRFLSNMSHEFRTPLNSIRALAKLLLDRIDGPLGAEQARQVELIRKAADDLTELVEDLLDIARIEAGKLEIHAAEFAVDDLFGALRGMLRPLLGGEVVLRFAAPGGVPRLVSDEAKVAQILRNFVSNALKFTEHGSVHVTARYDAPADRVVFEVADTGIGIAQGDLERIFEEFVQVQGPLQRRSRGSGLGLPLCRRLAEALGGEVSVASTLGQGSRFFLSLPRAPGHAGPGRARAGRREGATIPVLVVAEADAGWRYERLLEGTAYRALVAHTLGDARAQATRERPAAVVVDLQDVTAMSVIAEAFAATPVLSIGPRGTADGNANTHPTPTMPRPADRIALIEWLHHATRPRVLVVEDDATTRYTMRRLLEAASFAVLEAALGEDGMRIAVRETPAAIVLDIGLPDTSGLAVLERIDAEPRLRGTPVVICTSRELADGDVARLAARGCRVIAKRAMAGSLVEAVGAALGGAPAVPSEAQ